MWYCVNNIDWVLRSTPPSLITLHIKYLFKVCIDKRRREWRLLFSCLASGVAVRIKTRVFPLLPKVDVPVLYEALFIFVTFPFVINKCNNSNRVSSTVELPWSQDNSDLSFRAFTHKMQKEPSSQRERGRYCWVKTSLVPTDSDRLFSSLGWETGLYVSRPRPI